MKSSPLFNNIETGYVAADQATYKGVAAKTGFYLLIVILIGALTAYMLPGITNMNGFYILLMVSSIVGFISVIIGRTKPSAAKICGVIYSLCEGLFVGTFTCIAESMFPGIGYLAVGSTLIIFLVMLGLYSFRIIKVTNKMRSFVMAFGIGLILVLIFTSIVGVFVPQIFQNFALFIGIEVVLLAYGAFVLLMNFSEVNAIVSSGCEKSYEWSVSLGLIVSIIYIYIEVLRLLMMILSRQD